MLYISENNVDDFIDNNIDYKKKLSLEISVLFIKQIYKIYELQYIIFTYM